MILINVPFVFKHLQFPVQFVFEMTINKAQDQSLQVCEINLENPYFSHWQFYVACWRVGKVSNIFVNARKNKSLGGFVSGGCGQASCSWVTTDISRSHNPTVRPGQICELLSAVVERDIVIGAGLQLGCMSNCSRPLRWYPNGRGFSGHRNYHLYLATLKLRPNVWFSL